MDLSHFKEIETRAMADEWAKRAVDRAYADSGAFGSDPDKWLSLAQSANVKGLRTSDPARHDKILAAATEAAFSFDALEAAWRAPLKP